MALSPESELKLNEWLSNICKKQGVNHNDATQVVACIWRNLEKIKNNAVIDAELSAQRIEILDIRKQLFEDEGAQLGAHLPTNIEYN